MEGSISPASRPLLVTSRTYPGGDWADVAGGADEGWSLWQARRHATVFADFGHLGQGMSGVRLARLLRAASREVRIFLLSDTADPSQKVWARANGADDVIYRKARSIAARLSGFYPGATGTMAAATLDGAVRDGSSTGAITSVHGRATRDGDAVASRGAPAPPRGGRHALHALPPAVLVRRSAGK